MNDIMDWYSKNQQKLLLIKILFADFLYQYGYSSLANKMIKNSVMKIINEEIPEISFTVINTSAVV